MKTKMIYRTTTLPQFKKLVEKMDKTYNETHVIIQVWSRPVAKDGLKMRHKFAVIPKN